MNVCPYLFVLSAFHTSLHFQGCFFVFRGNSIFVLNRNKSQPCRALFAKRREKPVYVCGIPTLIVCLWAAVSKRKRPRTAKRVEQVKIITIVSTYAIFLLITYAQYHSLNPNADSSRLEI